MIICYKSFSYKYHNCTYVFNQSFQLFVILPPSQCCWLQLKMFSKTKLHIFLKENTNNVITGFDPELWHSTSYDLSADRNFSFVKIWTAAGFTVSQNVSRFKINSINITRWKEELLELGLLILGKAEVNDNS